MKNIVCGYYNIGKKQLKQSENNLPGSIHSLIFLRKKAREFKKLFSNKELIIFKGVPYIWDNHKKNYFMYTGDPTLLACMEYEIFQLKL